MPLRVIGQPSTARNGMSGFIMQCKNIQFGYCNWAGSSRGMNAFLTTHLEAFVKKYPQIPIDVKKRPHRHPIIRAQYVNGREKVICVRNMRPSEILEKLELLRDASGLKLKRYKHVVQSENDSVRDTLSQLDYSP